MTRPGRAPLFHLSVSFRAWRLLTFAHVMSSVTAHFNGDGVRFGQNIGGGNRFALGEYDKDNETWCEMKRLRHPHTARDCAKRTQQTTTIDREAAGEDEAELCSSSSIGLLLLMWPPRSG